MWIVLILRYMCCNLLSDVLVRLFRKHSFSLIPYFSFLETINECHKTNSSLDSVTIMMSIVHILA